ncbi:hypothetical protein [Methanocella conradii]|uniref:hypothetical protein n=1 Tax=Methanocella conradii TaxID=1175444 RepID=UPI0024B3411E|nr:hypothetical protein [Methanocella conradii]MDI6896917.1 hypothetical protein [Methanocella conradii]
MSNSDPTINLKGYAQALVAHESYAASAETSRPGQVEPDRARLKSTPSVNMTHASEANISARMQTGMRISRRVKWASAILALFGLALIGASLAMSPAATLSAVLSIAGVSVFLSSLLFYFVTPHRLVSGDVCDAEAISGVELANDLLAPLAGDSKGIYMSRGKSTKIFIPARKSELIKEYGKNAGIAGMNISGIEGILITPPGQGLLEYAKSLGATFSAEGLESEIVDALVNGMELASRVDVRRGPDNVYVRLYGLADSPMCKRIRQTRPTLCYQAACPICSFVACMVAEGTGKPVMVSAIKADRKAVDITYTLLG